MTSQETCPEITVPCAERTPADRSLVTGSSEGAASGRVTAPRLVRAGRRNANVTRFTLFIYTGKLLKSGEFACNKMILDKNSFAGEYSKRL